ncbi:MAG TPA: MFS transporter, partial [Burkholderiaceae bacterium]|nr:MFS transporter [Burkholderiaceae bacterium]
LSRSYVVGSVMLWIAYFMGLVIFYSLINWMPILFKDAGIDPKSATLIAALFPLGGVGAIFFGWLMDRVNGNIVVSVAFALTAVSVYAVGQAAGNVGLLVVLVFVAGTFMNTGQTCLPSLAAAYYPTRGRATGVAWMMAIGRFGGIAGSFLVAELTRQKTGFAGIFGIIAIAGAIAAAALIIKQLASPESGAQEAAGRGEALGH